MKIIPNTISTKLARSLGIYRSPTKNTTESKHISTIIFGDINIDHHERGYYCFLRGKPIYDINYPTYIEEVKGYINKYWTLNGKFHRGNDLPAIDCISGGTIVESLKIIRDEFLEPNSGQHWYLYGLRHRDDDKPAFISDVLGERYWVMGKMHRDGDKPAYIFKNDRAWVKNGKFHRDNGRPAKFIEGTFMWMVDGELHRDRTIIKGINDDIVYSADDMEINEYDLPAVIPHDYSEILYYKHGKLIKRVKKPTDITSENYAKYMEIINRALPIPPYY